MGCFRAGHMGSLVVLAAIALTGCSFQPPLYEGLATPQTEADALPKGIGQPEGAQEGTSRLVGTHAGFDYFLTKYSDDQNRDGVCIVVVGTVDSGQGFSSCSTRSPLTSEGQGFGARYLGVDAGGVPVPSGWIRLSENLIVKE